MLYTWIHACYTVGTEPWGQVQGQSQAGALDQAQLPCPSLPCPPTPRPLEHLVNGQNLIGAWGEP